MPRKSSRTFAFTVLTATLEQIVVPDPKIIEIDLANTDGVNPLNLFWSSADATGFPIDAGQKAILTEEDGDDIKNGLLAQSDTADVVTRVRIVTEIEDS